MNVAMDGGKLNICFVSDDIIGSAIKPYQTKDTYRESRTRRIEEQYEMPIKASRKKSSSLLEESESCQKQKRYSAQLNGLSEHVDGNEECEPINEDIDEENEDDNNEDSSEEASSDIEEASPSAQGGKLKINVEESNARKKTRKAEREVSRLKEMAEEYFAVHHQKKIVTSDRTLAKIQNPRMTQKDLNAHLDEAAGSHRKERSRLFRTYTSMFPKWIFQLRHGFNILLHGLGSKRRLLEEFRKQMLPDLVHIVINGFFPSLTIKNILNMISDDILNYGGSFKNIIDQCNFIKSEYSTEDAEELFLVIHNADGHMLRSSKAQNALSYLASSSKIHVIASIDHINAPIVWDQNHSSRYNWLWFDVTTYDRYTEETSFENSLLVQQTGSLALSSLTHVLRSLTPNARGIFMLLAEYQLECADDQNGISFGDLYKKSRERFLVNSDLTLRAQLTEFKDHKLIKFKKGFDGVETLSIPLTLSCLKQFMEEQSS